MRKFLIIEVLKWEIIEFFFGRGDISLNCSLVLMFSIIILIINVHSLNHSYFIGSELDLDHRPYSWFRQWHLCHFPVKIFGLIISFISVAYFIWTSGNLQLAKHSSKCMHVCVCVCVLHVCDVGHFILYSQWNLGYIWGSNTITMKHFVCLD